MQLPGARSHVGIEVDEKAVRKAAQGWTGWPHPVWRYSDGRFAEW